jgi:uncharacterized protein
MDEAMIAKFQDIDLLGFQITLDGHRERHNKIRNNNGTPSYDRIIENINLLCKNIEKISVTLRINYDHQTLKNQQAEQILNDIEKDNQDKIHIDLQRVWQTVQPNNIVKDNKDVASLIAAAKKIGFKKVGCTGGITTGQFYNCYTSKYHYVEFNYDGKVYRCTARGYQEPYEMGVLQEDGVIIWNEARISKLYARPTFDNEVCLKCAYLPLCWGPCPQKMVEMKEHGFICVVKNMERSMKELIVDSYESAVNSVKQNLKL